MPILATRFFPPPLPVNSIRRERLVSAISDEWHRGRQVVMLQGPAGYGKTTTLIQFAHQAKGEGARLVWVSLDADDNHPKQFFQCLLHACEALEDVSLPSSSVIENVGPKQAVDKLLYALPEANDRPVILCLDDLHVINDQETLQVLAKLIASSAGRLTLCCGSREPMPILRARLKTHGHLYEVDAKDLRFNLDESRALLEKITVISLNDEELQQLHEKTDGWPALLVLAIVESGRKFDASKWVKGFSGRQEDVAAYLTEEIVDGFPEELLRCLLQISIVERFSDSLCEALTGVEQLPNKLMELSAVNLLMHRLDDEGRWFRIHPILRDFFIQRLELNFSEADKNDLYHRASIWCEDNGMTFAAFEYAVDSGDHDRAVVLLREHGVGMIVESYFPGFLGLIRRLPANVLSSNPQLLLDQAWALMIIYENNRCLQMVDELKQLYSEKDPLPERVSNEIQAMMICQRLYAEETEEILLEAAPFLAREQLQPLYLQNSVRIVYAISLYRKNRLQEALVQANACIADNITPNLLFSALMAWCLRIVIALTQGQIAIARSENSKLREFVDESVQEDSLVHSFVYSMDAVVSYFSGDLSRAMKLLGQHSVVESRVVEPTLLCWVVPIQARLLTELGLVDEAILSLRTAWYFAEEKQLAGLGACAGGELIRLYARSGQASQAEEVIAKVRRYFMFDKGPQDDLCQNFLTLAEARLAIAECDTARAGVKLKALYSEFQAANRHLQAIECQLELADCYLVAGKEDRCAAALRQAMSMDSALESLQVFRSASQGVLQHLQKMEKHNQSPRIKSFIIKVLEGVQLTEPKRDVDPLAESLSPGERKVMAGLVQGMSNQAIAEDLGLSINTIKAYLKTAYGKLGVSSRTQAVARVNELNITF